MTFGMLRSALTLRCVAVIVLSLAGCSEADGRPPPDHVINIGFDAGIAGCAQPTFPAEQPDLTALAPPRFLLTTNAAQQSSTGQAQVDPGDPIEAEITVNSATRRVKVELANAWVSQQFIYTDEVETAGNETVSLLLFSEENVRGRYYMKLTLCGFDCDEREVVFDILACLDDADVVGPCGINAPYERTVIEDRDITQVDSTCIDLLARPGVGSGTILIQ